MGGRAFVDIRPINTLSSSPGGKGTKGLNGATFFFDRNTCNLAP